MERIVALLGVYVVLFMLQIFEKILLVKLAFYINQLH